MDVYGFYGANCPYPYNQSDELAKQMYSQQSLASMPYPREPAPQNMLMPSGNPWNSRGLTWGMQSPPHVVQFTGQTPFKDETVAPVVHCKRKSLDVEPAIPAKQLITEEKMAAHLNSLHISSDYTGHSSGEENMDVLMDSDEPVIQKLKGHTIVLSEEAKRITEEPILPAVLIERLEKPSMSLVVWKPRESILEQIKETEPKLEEEDVKKRNGVFVDDSNDINMWLSNGPDKWNMKE